MSDPIPTPDVDPIVATPSADNGNVSLETEPVAPSAEPAKTDAQPVTTPEPVTPTTEPSAEDLFELPDGRKVDAATLSKEWKENFYPDYTRKSQALAAKENGGTPNITTQTANSLEDWVPSSYAEIIQKAKEEMKLDQQREREQAEAQVKAIEDTVSSQLTEIKTKDPNVNENALFLHATKYGFRDLRLAHQNMKDMGEIIKKTQTTTVQQVQKRNDPVSTATPGGATGARPDPSQFSNAREYLRSLK